MKRSIAEVTLKSIRPDGETLKRKHPFPPSAGPVNANTRGGIQENYSNSGPGIQYNAQKQHFGRDQGKGSIYLIRMYGGPKPCQRD